MGAFTRKRIADEVIEIVCGKLTTLPQPEDVTSSFSFEPISINPVVTDDPLDVAEVTMSLENAFAVSFENRHVGDEGINTIGEIIEYIAERLVDKD